MFFLHRCRTWRPNTAKRTTRRLNLWATSILCATRSALAIHRSCPFPLRRRNLIAKQCCASSVRPRALRSSGVVLQARCAATTIFMRVRMAALAPAAAAAMARVSVLTLNRLQGATAARRRQAWRAAQACAAPGGRPGGSAAAAFRASRRPPPRDGAAGRAGTRGGAAARWRAKAAKDDDSRDPTATRDVGPEAKSEAKSVGLGDDPDDGLAGAGAIDSPSPALRARFGNGNSSNSGVSNSRFGAPTEPIDPLGEFAGTLDAQCKTDAKATGGELKGGGIAGRCGPTRQGPGLGMGGKQSARTTPRTSRRKPRASRNDVTVMIRLITKMRGRVATRRLAVVREGGDRQRQPLDRTGASDSQRRT